MTFSFLPFVFGAAQLVRHTELPPERAMDEIMLERFGDDYMFIGCLRFILQVKTGSFFEHSPILYDILTTVPDLAAH